MCTNKVSENSATLSLHVMVLKNQSALLSVCSLFNMFCRYAVQSAHSLPTSPVKARQKGIIQNAACGTIS